MPSSTLIFYATAADLAALQPRLEAVAPIAILLDDAPTPSPQHVATFDVRDETGPRLSFRLCRRADLALVASRYIPERARWYLDPTRSPLVELTASHIEGRTFHRGQLYFTSSYVDDAGVRVTKPADFRAWAQRLRQLTAETFVRHGHHHVGPDAVRLLRAAHGTLEEG